MFSNTYIAIIVFSILIILSFGFNIISKKTKIPSVLLLLFLGIGAQLVVGDTSSVSNLDKFLEFFGLIGLLLIVLEGALDLKLSRDKKKLILQALLSAIVVLLATSFLIALVFYIIGDIEFKACLINAIPLSIISSAIAIPSVANLIGAKKEFIVYESIFSDILGIIFFNLIVHTEHFTVGSLGILGIQIIAMTVIGFIATYIILFFLSKSNSNVRFFLIIAFLTLFFAIGKYYHISSLYMVLIIGLLLGNYNKIFKNKLAKGLDPEKITPSIKLLDMVTIESAFLIRTIFFFIFGFSLQIKSLADPKVLIAGTLICVIIYGVRSLYIKYLTSLKQIPNLLVAPRGLITILLFFSIPEEFSIGFVSEGVLFFVILVSGITMMIGLMIKEPKKIVIDPNSENEENNPCESKRFSPVEDDYGSDIDFDYFKENNDQE